MTNLPHFDLGPLETFQKEVFLDTDKQKQEICNFVLGLACIHSDFKNILWAHYGLTDAKPEGEFQYTPLWGQYSALRDHLYRALCSVLLEFLKLLEENRPNLSNDLIERTVQSMTRRTRESWAELLDMALNRRGDSPTLRAINRIRDKVIFHYDLKELERGYREHFSDPAKANVDAFISRGKTLENSRFYFADAAMNGYIRSRYRDAPDFQTDVKEISEKANNVLHEFVERFIQRRGGAFRTYQ